MLEDKSNSSFGSQKTQNQSLSDPNQTRTTTATTNGQNNNQTLSNFDVLISTVHTSFAEVQSATQDLLEFKDQLLTHYLPPPLLIKLTCLYARLYRSFSDLNPPVNELLRLVKLYSSPWSKQTAVMKRLYREGEQKRALLNIAIRRLAIAEKRTKGWEQEQRVLNWERLYLRMSEAKGLGRRWRFRVEGVKQKAEEGYDELVKWINMRDGYDMEAEDEQEDMGSQDDMMLDERNGASHVERDYGDEDDEEIDIDMDGAGEEGTGDGGERKATRGGRGQQRPSERRPVDRNELQRRRAKLMGSQTKKKRPGRERYDDDLRNLNVDLDRKSELSGGEDTDRPQRDGKKSAAGEDNDMVEIDSDQELFSDVSSTIQPKKKPEEPKVFAYANTQTEPVVEHKNTWTGEPDYKKFFIVRVYKPAEFGPKRVKFTVKYDDQVFVSKIFEAIKRVKISESPLRKLGGRNPKDTSQKDDPNLEKKIDMNKYEDFLFEINDSFRRREEGLNLSIHETNSIRFEMTTEDDEKIELESVIRIDDINTLDLPTLYFKPNDKAVVVDFYDDTDENDGYAYKQIAGVSREKSSQKLETSKSLLRKSDMTFESAEKYELLSRRTPFTFDMDKKKVVEDENADVKVEEEKTTKVGLKSESRSSFKLPCKLPLMFFWLNKPIEYVQHKNTATQSLNDVVKDMIGLDLSSTSASELEKMLRKRGDGIDKSISPMSSDPLKPPTTPRDSSSNKSKTISWDASQVKTSDDLDFIHDAYQSQINELNYTILKLEEEITQLKINTELKTEMGRTRGGAGSRRDRGGYMYSRSPEKVVREKTNIGMAGGGSDGGGPRRYVPQYQPTQHPPQQQQQSVKQQPPVFDGDFQEKFLKRLKFFSEKSNAHQKELFDKYVNQEASTIEKQMAVQRRLDNTQAATNNENNENNEAQEDFCLPAVFMPFKSPNNVYNPRAYQYFHPSGSTDVRVTQPPTMLQLPPLPPKPTLSVINLYELGERYHAANSDYFIRQLMNKAISNNTSNTATSELATESAATNVLIKQEAENKIK